MIHEGVSVLVTEVGKKVVLDFQTKLVGHGSQTLLKPWYMQEESVCRHGIEGR